MVESTRTSTPGESIGGLASLLVSCVTEEERLLDSICQAVSAGDDEAVLSLARQLSSLRTTGAGSKLCECS